MKNKIPLIIIGLLALLGLSAFIAFRVHVVNSSSVVSGPGNGIVLFYGSTCPHCVKVEKFMADNKVEEKISLEKKEVFGDKQNAVLLGAAAKKCGLNTADIGVPFLWDGKTAKCIVGDSEIISFFQQKISQ